MTKRRTAQQHMYDQVADGYWRKLPFPARADAFVAVDIDGIWLDVALEFADERIVP